MPPGVDKLKHIVVLMMENRSFDHMLGALKATNPLIDGLNGTETNPDVNGNPVQVQPQAEFQGQLDPDPNHHFPGVDLQIFNGDQSDPRVASMKGFVKSYFGEQNNLAHSQKIMYYFTPDKLPVLTSLAKDFAVFNRWFASIPGPTLCNRAFAHYGTSFGHVGMEIFYANTQYKSIYQRMIDAGRTAKIYYFDQASSTMEVVNLLQDQPQIFAIYDQFLSDCDKGLLPDYCLVEPNYSDHDDEIASDQHPDHHVRAGELLIASVYNAIKANDDLWQSTALLITYDEHGGIHDHVVPPACTPDAPFIAQPKDTGTPLPFQFDRLGVRVPAILVSPWVPKGTVVDGRIFEHACIPATVTKFFLGDYDPRSPREKAAETFHDLLTSPALRTDCPDFDVP